MKFTTSIHELVIYVLCGIMLLFALIMIILITHESNKRLRSNEPREPKILDNDVWLAHYKNTKLNKK